MNAVGMILKKEFRLQQNNFVFVLSSLGILIACGFLNRTSLANYQFDFGALQNLFLLMINIMGIIVPMMLAPSMIGGSATGGEQLFSTKLWQGSLPVSSPLYYIVKVGAVAAIVALTAMIFLFTYTLVSKENVDLSIIILPLLFGAVGLYCGTIVDTPLKSVFLSFPIVLSIIFFYTLTVHFESLIMCGERTSNIYMPDEQWLVGAAIMFVVYGYWNFKQEPRIRAAHFYQYLSICAVMMLSKLIPLVVTGRVSRC